MLTFEDQTARPRWALPVRLASAVAVTAYARSAYRVRRWGRIPASGEPTLVLSNHQIDFDLMAIIAELGLRGGWRRPLFSVSAKLLYEPGFFAIRIPWLAPVFRGANLGVLFGAMGFLPIENELRTRSLARWAFAVQRLYGVLPLEDVFVPRTIERYRLAGLRTTDLFTARHFTVAQQRVKLSDLHPAHRREQFEITANGVEEDLRRIEAYLRRGATFFVTPEGEYSRDGAMLPFRGIWSRLEPIAKRVFLAAVSYDPFVGRRLSQLYRIVPLCNPSNVVAELAAARPVTTSAMLASWLRTTPAPFSAEQARQGVRRIFHGLPASVFVDPECGQRGDALVEDALRAMLRLGILTRGPHGYQLSERRMHPRFQSVEDIVAFQARFFTETLNQRSTPSRASISR